MKPLDVMLGMREILSDPNRWTQKTAARDAAGIDVSPVDDGATCFCLYGAAIRFVGEDNSLVTHTVNALRSVKRQLHGGAPSIWQDQPETTHAMVLDFLDLAIATEQAKAVSP